MCLVCTHKNAVTEAIMRPTATTIIIIIIAPVFFSFLNKHHVAIGLKLAAVWNLRRLELAAFKTCCHLKLVV